MISRSRFVVAGFPLSVFINLIVLLSSFQNPERLRVLSHSEATDASYRIQFDPEEEYEYFCFLAPGEEVLLAPDESEENDEMDAMEEEVFPDEDGDDAMEDDVEAEERDAKRQKLDDGGGADL